MSLSYLISILTRQRSRFSLSGEALEDRCQLSALPLVTLETAELCGWSQIITASAAREPQSPLASEVLANAGSTQLVLLDSVSLDGDITAGSAAEVAEAWNDVPTQPLIAVQPDEGVDPFVDCPGLDERFCLPSDVDFGFDIDILDGLIFDVQIPFTDVFFDAGHQVSEYDLLFPGDRQLR